jgi:hypothetical protein
MISGPSVSRRTAQLLGDVFYEEFIETASFGPDHPALDAKKLRDFLYAEGFDNWFLNTTRFGGNRTSPTLIRDFIMDLHTGDSVVIGRTADMSLREGQEAGQKYLVKLAEAIIRRHESVQPRPRSLPDGLAKVVESLSTDGFAYHDGRLLQTHGRDGVIGNMVGQATANAVVEILQARYLRLQSCGGDELLLELEGFVSFIRENRLMKRFSKELDDEVINHYAEYSGRIDQEKAEAIRISDLLRQRCPEMDDRDLERPEDPLESWAYTHSFAEFDNIVNGSRSRFGYPLERPDRYDDNTDVGTLIQILRSKVERAEASGRKLDEDILYGLQDLESAHTYTHRSWINYQLTAAGIALLLLTEVARNVNPLPEDLSKWRTMTTQEKYHNTLETLFTGPGFSWVEAILYGPAESCGPFTSAASAHVARIKDNVKRVFDAMRERALAAEYPAVLQGAAAPVQTEAESLSNEPSLTIPSVGTYKLIKPLIGFRADSAKARRVSLPEQRFPNDEIQSQQQTARRLYHKNAEITWTERRQSR